MELNKGEWNLNKDGWNRTKANELEQRRKKSNKDAMKGIEQRRKQ
jgi:hypothetical protein